MTSYLKLYYRAAENLISAIKQKSKINIIFSFIYTIHNKKYKKMDMFKKEKKNHPEKVLIITI